MKKKIFGAAFIATMAVAAGLNFGQSNNDARLSDLVLENVEALANDEVIPGKICYYRGTSVYEDYIPCIANYPNIGKCGMRERAFYSKSTGQCYE